MKRLLLAAVVAASGCAGGPSPEEREEIAFKRIDLLLGRYNAALEMRDPLRLESAAGELRQLVTTEFAIVTAVTAKGSPERRAAAASALGFSRNRDAVGILVEATRAAEVETRANAAAALGMLAFSDTDPARLLELLSDPSSRVRGAALFGIRSMAGDANAAALVAPVLRMLDDADASVRNEALVVLRKLRRPEAREAILEKSARDPDPVVRANAALAVGAFGREGAAANPRLIEMLRDETSKVVEAAWAALNRINEKDFDRSYGTWREWYEDELRHHYVCEEHKATAHAAAGTCPTCGAKLDRVPKEASKKKKETGGFFVCADHPEIQVLGPSSCGKCGKPLVPGTPPPQLYQCSVHPEVVASSPVPCGRLGCGKPLVPKAP
jgi:HEAT repeat protein